MRFTIRYLALLPAIAALGACTSLPTGPSVMALPGTGKNFDQFRADDADCRSFALGQVGGTTSQQAAVDSGVKSAAVGTVIGAAAGAALGGHEGAAAGAGVGLLAGSAAGAGAGQVSGYAVQQRYDNAYIQCMYAKGQRVPVAGELAGRREYRRYATPYRQYAPPPPPRHVAPPGYVPPPPPGYAPPPPYGR